MNTMSILLQVTPANQNLWINLAVVLIATVLFILTIYLYIKLRTKNYERERGLLEEKVSVRTRQLIDQNIELEKLSIVASRTDNAVMILGADETIEWSNVAFSRMRRSENESEKYLTGKKISDTNFYPDIRKNLDECLLQKKSVRFESSISDNAGNNRWVSSLLTPIFEENLLKKFVIVDTDISPNKELEEKLKSSLHEKEILLREIHHRVKNNLQVIISLLNLQSGYIQDEATLRAVKEGENRVRSMALVHEKFYQSEGISEIDFAEYVEKLCQYIFQSFPEAAHRVKLNVESDNVAFDLDTAMPCGLLINEIVSNSLKYAFPDGQEGEITIRLKSIGNKVNISISDNGKGIAEEYDLKNPTTLGLQLIDALTSQLNGEVEMGRNGGTVFNITFTYPR